jgi:hypothetical protein
MEQKDKVFKWLSVVLLSAGFLTYVVYLFCRKPAGMSGSEYDHIGWFIVDVFMIGGALLGLLMPKRFGKLGGFSIVGLSFANLVMTAVEDTASLFFINKANNSEPYTQAELWLGTFSGIIAMIAIICLIFALAFPKAAKVLGPAAAIAFAITGLMALVEGILAWTMSSLPWAFGINLVAVCLIVLGLAAGLQVYAWL